MDTKKIDIKRLLGRGELQLERPPTKVLATIAGQGCHPSREDFQAPSRSYFLHRSDGRYLSYKIVCNDVDAPFQIQRADIRRGFQKSTGYEEAIY